MTLKLNKYYVYHHLINGVLFYVGMGRNNRAFEIIRPPNWTFARDVLFAKFQTQEIEINIVDYFDTKRDAQLFETLEIRKHRPIANSVDGKYALWVQEEDRFGWDASLLDKAIS